jgi:hypothetical protein
MVRFSKGFVTAHHPEETSQQHIYHTTGFSRGEVIDLCVLINSVERRPGFLKWPTIPGLFKSVTAPADRTRPGQGPPGRRDAVHSGSAPFLARGSGTGQRSGMAPAVTAAPITGRIAWRPWFRSSSPSRAHIFDGYPTAGSRLHRASLPCPARATLATCRPISTQRCG